MGKLKKSTEIIHKLVHGVALEPLFIRLGTLHPFFQKFIPLNSFYKEADTRIVKRDGVRFKLHIADYMQWHIYANIADNSWKKAAGFLKENSVVLDIGANSGAFCLKLANCIKEKKINDCSIFAFEPNPFVLEFLKTNLALNPGLQEIVRIFPFGLGDKEGSLSFEFAKTNSGGGRFSLSGDDGMTDPIRIRRLDDFINEQPINDISFIKLDVEGFEPLVLAGAMETIRKYKPGMFVEITDEWFRQRGDSAASVLNKLSNEGYTILVESGDDFVNVRDMKEQIAAIRQFNIMAVCQP